jgi:anaerobic selenocysteine-containing dehydrogenase
VVESKKGSLKLEAVLLEGMRPDTVSIPLGQGHTHLGRWAKGRGANPNEITLVGDDTLKGVGSFGKTYVRIAKI